MSLERKELINLTLGLDAFETWDDLVRNTTEQGWGFYLLSASDLVNARARDITSDQRQAWMDSIEAQRQRDRLALAESDSIQITTGRIDPKNLSYIGIYDGEEEKIYPREFGALVAAAGRNQMETLKFINTAVANLRRAERDSILEPIWGRNGNMQLYADFLGKPVSSFIKGRLMSEHLPRVSGFK